MKSIKKIILIMSLPISNTALSEPLTVDQKTSLLTELAKYVVYDYGINDERRLRLVSSVLGEEFADFTIELDPNNLASEAATIAAFSKAIDQSDALESTRILREVIKSSPNKYTKLLDKNVATKHANIIDLSRNCSIVHYRNLPKAHTIDLRGNGGGSLECAVKVAEKLISKGTSIPVNIINNKGMEELTLSGENTNSPINNRKVLVDASTASSAEFLAYALKNDGWRIDFNHDSKETYGKNQVMIEGGFRDVKFTISTGYFTIGTCQYESCKLKREQDY